MSKFVIDQDFDEETQTLHISVWKKNTSLAMGYEYWGEMDFRRNAE